MSDNSTNGSNEAFAGFGFASKSMQTLASEAARLSKETFDETTHLVEKLRGAKTIEDVVSIQTNYMQHSFSKYADYTRKVGELFAALPLEMAKQSQALMQKTAANVSKAAEQAGQHMQQGAEQVSAQVHQVTEHTSQQFEQAPQQFNQPYQDQNNNQNHDNQNYNNQGYQH